jgi:hypothetical protein
MRAFCGLVAVIVCASVTLAGAETAHFGIYNLSIIPLQRKARIFVCDSQSIFGNVAYLAGIPKIEGTTVAHLSFWRADWYPASQTFYAEGFTRRNVNSVKIVYNSPNSITGYFVSTDPAFSRPGLLQNKFDFQGERLSEEKELQTLARSPQADLSETAEGTYVGKDPGSDASRFELQLRSYQRQSARHWIASVQLGEYSIPMSGYEDVDGLLRLVRTPTNNASELSGLTLTALKSNDGKMTVKAIFYVPRNNSVRFLTLNKTRGIGAH